MNFICIGAQKSGTTWLHWNLSRHPEVWLPPMKELHYWDRERTRGRFSRAKAVFLKSNQWQLLRRGQLKQLMWYYRYFYGNWSVNWYKKLFLQAGDGTVTGDITPGYALLDGHTIDEVYRHFPKAKIIYLLRNPINRVISQINMVYRRHVQNGGLRGVFEEEYVEELLLRESVISHGFYSRTIDEWTARFGRSRVFVGFFDSLEADSEGLFREICRFLQIDDSPDVIPKDLREKVFSSGSEVASGEEYKKRFAQIYSDEISRLSDRYGSYASKWKEEVDALRE